MTAPERRGPERPGPDTPPEWDLEPDEWDDVCTCGHDVTDHGTDASPVGCITCDCPVFVPTREALP